MNKKHIDAEILKLLFFKYRAYILPLIGIVGSWVLLFNFVIPQFQNFLSTKDQIQASEQTLATLTQNYNVIATLNDTNINQQLDTANKALPKEKDFAGILNAISQAAASTGVTVEDYSFQIGNINLTSKDANGQSTQLTLVIKGDLNQAKSFLNSLSSTLPLSEVVSLNENNQTTAAITANFFFAPASNTIFVDTNPLPVLTNAQKSLLGDLNKNAQGQGLAPQVSSSSAH